jgi:hypothetical protein
LIVIAVLVLAIVSLVKYVFFSSVIALEPRLTVFFAPNLTSMSWCLSSKIDRLSSIVLETE